MRFLADSLRLRAVAILLGAVAVAALVAYLIFSPIFHRTFRAELSKRGEGLAKVLEAHQELRLALSMRDAARCKAILQDLLASDSDLRYAAVLDGEGHLISSATWVHISDDRMRELIALHKGSSADDSDDDLQRFTHDVQRTDVGGDDELLGGGAQGSKTLGKILLALSPEAGQRQLRYQMFSIISVTAVMLVGIFLVFFSRVSARLQTIETFAARIASGDLTAIMEKNGSDEIGRLSQSMIDMAQRTAAMVSRLQKAGEALGQTSSAIWQASSKQSETSGRQASSVTETATTATQLRQTSLLAKSKAEAVIGLAEKSEVSTSSGRSAVHQSVEAMKEIRQQAHEMAQKMDGLTQRANQIGLIIETVNDLAEQSNMLALNAAIEATRAGEHGKGFALVAREVRSMAERSKQATSQIRSILDELMRAVREATSVTMEGTKRSERGMELADRAGVALEALDRAINESSSAARQIAVSTAQQATGVEQISTAMADIRISVEESVREIQALEDASRNMKGLADEMRTLVAQYRVG
jgi:methyl-accepting chemotaxis protein